MGIVAYRFSERPELWERISDLSAEVWPEYNRHGDILNRYSDSTLRCLSRLSVRPLRR